MMESKEALLIEI